MRAAITSEMAPAPAPPPMVAASRMMAEKPEPVARGRDDLDEPQPEELVGAEQAHVPARAVGHRLGVERLGVRVLGHHRDVLAGARQVERDVVVALVSAPGGVGVVPGAGARHSHQITIGPGRRPAGYLPGRAQA